MIRRRAALLPIGLWFGYIAATIVVPLLMLAFVFHPAASPSIFAESWLLSGLLFPFVTVGAVIAAYRPDNRIGWLMLVIGYAWSEAGITTVYVENPDVVRGTPLSGWITWLGLWDFWVFAMLVSTVLPLLFPTGHLPSRRWWVVAWAAVATWALFSCYFGLGTEASANDQVPAVIRDLTLADEASVVLALALVSSLVAFGGAALSLIVRFRHASGIERQQLKWFAYVFAIVAVGFWLSAIQELSTTQPWQAIADIGFYVAGLGVLLGIPLAIAFAILRYRLYDIDRIINRTLVYSAVTVTLVIVYLSLVFVLGSLVRSATGESSSLVVAVSTLSIAALFRPLRSWIQASVDRRFYRHKYDADQMMAALSTRLREEIDLDTLADELQLIMSNTVQPTHVSLWLRSFHSASAVLYESRETR